MTYNVNDTIPCSFLYNLPEGTVVRSATGRVRVRSSETSIWVFDDNEVAEFVDHAILWLPQPEPDDSGSRLDRTLWGVRNRAVRDFGWTTSDEFDTKTHEKFYRELAEFILENYW